jgi:hypothetical protein
MRQTQRRIVAIVMLIAVGWYGTGPVLAEAVRATPAATPDARSVEAARVMLERGWRPTGQVVVQYEDGRIEKFHRPIPVVPAGRLAPAALAAAAAAQATGRWKWGGNSCYFDPNDSGPPQCREGETKGGRWKIQGYGVCVWDPNDSGPNQCDPNRPPPPPSPNAVINDNGVVATFTAWTDGSPWTWEGTIVVRGPEGDWIQVQQQVDLAPDYQDPKVVWSNPIQSFVPATLARARQCPAPCRPEGVAVKRVNPYPDWKNYWKCTAKNCALAAILNFIPFFGAPAFVAACFWSMADCAFGRLWEYSDVPREDREPPPLPFPTLDAPAAPPA